MIEKTISELIIIVILHFLAKMCFWRKIILSLKTTDLFTETTVIGTWKILWDLSLIKSFFLDFKGIGSLKYKEIRVSGAKLFWEEHINVDIKVQSVQF